MVGARGTEGPHSIDNSGPEDAQSIVGQNGASHLLARENQGAQEQAVDLVHLHSSTYIKSTRMHASLIHPRMPSARMSAPLTATVPYPCTYQDATGL